MFAAISKKNEVPQYAADCTSFVSGLNISKLVPPYIRQEGICSFRSLDFSAPTMTIIVSGNCSDFGHLQVSF